MTRAPSPPRNTTNVRLVRSTPKRNVGAVLPRALALALACYATAGPAAEPVPSTGTAERSTTAPSTRETGAMKVRVTIDGKSTTATLFDNPTARDFAALLPLTLTLEDYASTEKIAYPPRQLSTKDAPAGVDPEVGDIAYYAPWGNIAIFYRDFGYSTGLIKLGRFDTAMDGLSARTTMNATIEALGQ